MFMKRLLFNLRGSPSPTWIPSLGVQDIGPIGPDRNWKGIGISLLVILVVLSLIGMSIVLLSKGDVLTCLSCISFVGTFILSWFGRVLKTRFLLSQKRLWVCTAGSRERCCSDTSRVNTVYSDEMLWLRPTDDGDKHSGSQLTVDDLFHRNFQTHDPDAKWISGE